MTLEREVKLSLNVSPKGMDGARDAFRAVAKDAQAAATAADRFKVASEQITKAAPPRTLPRVFSVEGTSPATPKADSPTQPTSRNFDPDVYGLAPDRPFEPAVPLAPPPLPTPYDLAPEDEPPEALPAPRAMPGPSADLEAFHGLAEEMERAREAAKGLVEEVEPLPTVWDRFQDAQHAINTDMESMQHQLDKVNVALQPDVLERRVRMMLKLEEAQRKYREAVQDERKRQGADDGGRQGVSVGGILGKVGNFFGGSIGRIFSGLGQASGGITGLFSGTAGAGAAGAGAGAAAGAGAGGAGAGGLLAGGLIGGGGGMMALAGPIGAVAAGAAMAASAIKDLTLKMIDMAAAAAPGQYELFRQALADTQAVIGRTFVPVLELATDVARSFGDFLANILPTSAQVREALDPVKEAFQAVKEEMREVAPFIRDSFVVALKLMAQAVRQTVDQFRFALKMLDGMTGGFFKLYNQFTDPADKSSVGAAAAPARYMEVEDLGKQAALASFQLGTAGEQSQQSPEEKTAAGVTAIAQFVVQDLLPAVQEFRRRAGKTAGAIEGAVEGATGGMDPLGIMRGLLGWQG